MLEIENATKEIKLHRAHRIGTFSPTKIRPLAAKFAYYPDGENVHKSANKLKNTSFRISQQFPKEIMSKKLVPIIKDIQEKGQEAYTVVDKLLLTNNYTESPKSRVHMRVI